MQKYYPLLEPTFNREAIDCVLRTRRAHGGFVLLRTLDAHGNADDGASGRSLWSRPKPKTFQFFASLPRPLPALEKKERFFGFGSAFRLPKALFSLHLFESLHFAFFRLHADPRRYDDVKR